MFIANLKITDTSIFQKAALEVAKKNFKFTGTISDQTRSQIGMIILRALMDSPTVQELLSGELRDDLGLFGNIVNSTIESIAKHITESINIETSKKSKKAPTVNIKFMAKDIQAVIKVPGASFESNGHSVDWLEWLLTRGSRVIISDYWVFPHAKGQTRSGGTKVMQKISKTKRNPFRIDPAHSGTASNNFVTRALDTVRDEIISLIISSSMGVK